MIYCELHAHSDYSFLDGLNSIPLYVSTAKKLGFESIALTDHGNICGSYIFYKECKKQDLKPIIGAEVYISDSKQEKINQRHLILLVEKQIGWKNLCNLITIANLEGSDGGIFSRPKLTYEDLENFSEGLIALTACSSGVLNYWFNQEEFSKSYAFERAEIELIELKRIFQDNLYIEIMPYEYGYEYQSKLVELGIKHQVPFVVTGDIHYATKEDSAVHDALIAAQYKKKITDKVGFHDKMFYLKTERIVRSLLKKNHHYFSDRLIDSMIRNTKKISDSCDFNFEIQKTDLPTPYPGEDSQYKLINLCQEGWKIRNIEDDNGVYDARLDEELNLIFEKNFENYFLILQDIMSFCKEKGIITGAGRGSSAGSLVAYLLGITHVDPIEYDLLFFRFIDPSRSDLPDIDTDFQEDRRYEIFSYIIQKYGEDNVAHINTFAKLSAKTALSDMNRVFNILPSDSLKITKKLKTDVSLASQLADTENQELNTFFNKNRLPCLYASRLEGNNRQKGVHAAGVVVSVKKLRDSFPLENTKFILPAVSLDGWDELGLLKIDVLGLNYLMIFEKVIAQLKKEKNIDIDIYSIKPNDKKVLQSIFEDQTGIFQFDTSLMKKLIKDLKNTGDFKLMVDLNALARPGALHSGATAKYIEKQNKKTESNYYFPELKKYLHSTNGEILYQEQVMLICKDIADFTWAEVNKVRKIIGKTLGKEELNKWKQKFLDQGVKNGFDLEKLILLWNDIETFGGYGFNKSHAVSYSVIGYWCGYFRYYYPVEFYSNFIQFSGKEIISANCVQKLKSLGYDFVLPHINFSKEAMVYEDKKVYCGFAFVKGLGDKVIKEIVDKQPYDSVKDFFDKINKRVVNKNVQDILFKIRAFRDFYGEHYDEEYEQVLFKIRRSKKEVEKESNIDIADLIPILEGYEKIKQIIEQVKSESKIEFSTIEDSITYDEGEYVYLTVYIQDVVVKTSEWGDYAKMLLLDETGTIELHVPVSKFKKIESEIENLSKNSCVIKLIKTEGGEGSSFEELILTSDLLDKKFSSLFKQEITTGEIFDLSKYIRNIKINLYKYFTFKITHIKEHYTKTKQELMAFIKLEDENGREIECLAWPDFYKKQRTALIVGDWYQFQFDDAKDGKVYCGRNTKIKIIGSKKNQ